MVQTFLSPLGPRLVAACDIGPAMTVLDHYGEHFKQRYGRTIAARANAARTGRQDEFDHALERFCHDWDLGTPDHARFEMQHLLAVGTRT